MWTYSPPGRSPGTYESTAGTLSRILEERPGTTGFVVQNEAAIPALLTQLRLSGRVVPGDTTVVAICPDQVASQSSPRLTSVCIPAHEMGRRSNCWSPNCPVWTIPAAP